VLDSPATLFWPLSLSQLPSHFPSTPRASIAIKNSVNEHLISINGGGQQKQLNSQTGKQVKS